MPRTICTAVVIIAALAATGCEKILSEAAKTKPSPTISSVDALGGNWASVSSATTEQNVCTNFKWNVSQFSNGTASGTFSATCQSSLLVTGTGSATLSGDKNINWTMTGNSNAQGATACTVSIAGTAVWEGDQIRMPYSGTTCQGAVSGTEILRKS
jgi:hypothetical protein